MKMSQRDRILNHLTIYGSITDKEAEDLYGIRRTAARVHELRNSGVPIETTMIKVKNRYGQIVTIARYDLDKEEGAA